jgi:hypothetical protein
MGRWCVFLLCQPFHFGGRDKRASKREKDTIKNAVVYNLRLYLFYLLLHLLLPVSDKLFLQ